MSDRLRPIVVVLLTTFAGYHLLTTLGMLIAGVVIVTLNSSLASLASISGMWVFGAALSLVAVILAGVVWKRWMIADLIIGPTDAEEIAIDRIGLVSAGLSLMGAWLILAHLPTISMLLAGHFRSMDGSSRFWGATTGVWAQIGSGPSAMLGLGCVLFFLHPILARLLVREPERDLTR